MNSASDIADQAITKMELEDEGVITPDEKDKDKGADDAKDKPTSDDKDGKPGTGEDDKPEPGADDKKDEDEEEGTFTADDALEVEDKTPEPKKDEIPTVGAVQLSPAESKYIVDNIGEPLVIKGFVGEGENAKEVEIKAFTPGDLPADFKFASDAQMIAAQNGFANLEKKAESLVGTFRQQQSETQAQDFERRENEGIKADVSDLQKEGRFPKFKVQPGADGFDASAEAKLMQDVLNVMTERNDMYLKQYNQGRPYKHIGFSEAFDIFERTNPDRIAARKKDSEQQDEDKERGKVAGKVGSGGGEPAGKIQKPTIKSGTTITDILNRIDAED